MPTVAFGMVLKTIWFVSVDKLVIVSTLWSILYFRSKYLLNAFMHL